MSVHHAFATLLTSDAYLPGALTIAAALDDVHQPFPLVPYETVCLVTPETVDVSAIRLLRKAFRVVIGVEIICPPEIDSLDLLGRPDLDTALTKLHVFRLTQYSKVIFLDADVLPLRPLSHLFHLDHEFSAAPDVGWPDIFNSGVMVLSPGEDKFKELQELLNSRGSWDGADQGLLNEWRGSNWNRLSFTYNTTPTAIYTYAPAYQRFGSQISAIHFIGPNKPWHSIPYRAPGPSAQSTDMDVGSSVEPPPSPQCVYDYVSLVDRWYSVYDRHYRSHAAEPVFQPSKYTSAWNEGDSCHLKATGGTLGLEDLRRAALEGMGATGISLPQTHGEGEYRTMPLEGRFDLIRPRTRAERKRAQSLKDRVETLESVTLPAEPSVTMSEPSTPPHQILSLPSNSLARWMTLPTPGIHEIPPAPHARLISLPPTPLHHVSISHKPRRDTREAGAQTAFISSQRESESADLRPTSVWNSVVETPPNVAMPPPSDTYFPKVWDVDQNRSSISSSSSDTSLTTVEPSPSKLRPSPSAVFDSSLMSVTPGILRRQGHYRNITREEGRSPTPDPSKVKRIFPWEERPRRAPGRVFPDESLSLAGATPERKAAFRSPMPSPLVGFPSLLQSRYQSDSPTPQRHAGGVSWPVSSASPLDLRSELDKAETSSQDGDVEDETDSEKETALKSRARNSSVELVKRTPKYRSIGVQTDPMDLEDTQAITSVPATEVAEKFVLMNKRLGRNWVTTSSPLSLPTPTKLEPVEPGGPSLPSTSSVNLSVTSPPSTVSPISSHVRKASRVWDPARGVETFKRGSEEVLTKFMQKGT